MKYNNIYGWTTNKIRFSGKNIDDNGKVLNGFYSVENSKTKTVILFHNGYKNITYKFPNIEIPFKSNMNRWENLFYVQNSGKRYLIKEDKYMEYGIVDDVLNEVKPVAFYINEDNIIDDLINKIPDDSCFSCNAERRNWQGRPELELINSKLISSMFNLNDLIVSYRLFSEKVKFDVLSNDEEQYILSLHDKRIIDVLNWDVANPFGNLQYVLNGLFLGYPIESTIAVLTGKVS